MNRGGVFVDAMGDEFAEMAPALRRFHSIEGRYRFEGRVTVLPPGSRAARIVAWIARAPVARTDAPFAFELNATPTHQAWIRHFPDRRMSSRLTATQRGPTGLVIERVSVASFRLEPTVRDAALHLDLVGFRVLGLPIPRWGWPQVRAIETQVGDHRIAFDIEASLPVLGRIAAYRGWIELGES